MHLQRDLSELAHAVMGNGKSEICRIDQQTENMHAYVCAHPPTILLLPFPKETVYNHIQYLLPA